MELDYLHLDHNELTGSVSAQLGQLQKLRDIYTFDNNLTGAIPKELGNCSRPTALNLQAKLAGPIPRSFGKCTQLAWFKVTNKYRVKCTRYLQQNAGSEASGSHRKWIHRCHTCGAWLGGGQITGANI